MPKEGATEFFPRKHARKRNESDGSDRAVTLSAGAGPVTHRPKIHQAGHGRFCQNAKTIQIEVVDLAIAEFGWAVNNLTVSFLDS